MNDLPSSKLTQVYSGYSGTCRSSFPPGCNERSGPQWRSGWELYSRPNAACNSHFSPIHSYSDLVLSQWLRSLDGLNTHDDAYRLSISGGLTTAVVLPGSANAIGGQAFVIKLRPTAERSPTSMLLEPPHILNGSLAQEELPLRWRQMKQACGENPSRVYSGTRMDTIWSFRKAYDTARQIKHKQDDYCTKALSGNWDSLEGAFPEDLQWEMLVDVLRGRVKARIATYSRRTLAN